MTTTNSFFYQFVFICFRARKKSKASKQKALMVHHSCQISCNCTANALGCSESVCFGRCSAWLEQILLQRRVPLRQKVILLHFAHTQNTTSSHHIRHAAELNVVPLGDTSPASVKPSKSALSDHPRWAQAVSVTCFFPCELMMLWESFHQPLLQSTTFDFCKTQHRNGRLQLDLNLIQE